MVRVVRVVVTGGGGDMFILYCIVCMYKINMCTPNFRVIVPIAKRASKSPFTLVSSFSFVRINHERFVLGPALDVFVVITATGSMPSRQCQYIYIYTYIHIYIENYSSADTARA